MTPGAVAAARGWLATTISVPDAAVWTVVDLWEQLLPGVQPGPAVTTHADVEQLLVAVQETALDRTTAGAEPPDLRWAPLLVLTTTPAPGSLPPFAVASRLGGAVGIRVVILGPWDYGPTWHINPAGYVTADGGQYPGRVSILDPATTAAVLALTTTPPPRAPAGPVDVDHSLNDRDRQPMVGGNDQANEPHAGVPPVTAGRLVPRLRLLGQTELTLAPTGTVVALPRRASMDVLILLAIHHPAGISRADLLDALWPDVSMRAATTRLHTAVSTLRRTIQTAGGSDPIRRAQDRYQLDAATVDVDLWRLRAAVLRAATAATIDERHAAMHAVTLLYTGTLGGDDQRPWLDPHRETVRRHVLDAYTTLADTTTDPPARHALLTAAAMIDPVNEAVHAALTGTGRGHAQL